MFSSLLFLSSFSLLFLLFSSFSGAAADSAIARPNESDEPGSVGLEKRSLQRTFTTTGVPATAAFRPPPLTSHMRTSGLAGSSLSSVGDPVTCSPSMVMWIAYVPLTSPIHCML